MRSPITAFTFFITSVGLWLRYSLPWKTKGYLRDECKRLSDLKQSSDAGMKSLSDLVDDLLEQRAGLRKEVVAAEQDAADERSARTEMEGARIQEHEAVRRMMFGLSHGLEGTLSLVNEFIVRLPDCTPDQADKAQVMQGLVRQVH
jgi:hypothetical protein